MRAQPERPHIIVVLVDDLGVRDLGCTGSTFYETPRLDRMAAEGVQFDNAYAASSLCSPARAAILTGRHPLVRRHCGGTDSPARWRRRIPAGRRCPARTGGVVAAD